MLQAVSEALQAAAATAKPSDATRRTVSAALASAPLDAAAPPQLVTMFTQWRQRPHARSLASDAVAGELSGAVARGVAAAADTAAAAAAVCGAVDQHVAAADDGVAADLATLVTHSVAGAAPVATVVAVAGLAPPPGVLATAVRLHDGGGGGVTHRDKFWSRVFVTLAHRWPVAVATVANMTPPVLPPPVLVALAPVPQVFGCVAPALLRLLAPSAATPATASTTAAGSGSPASAKRRRGRGGGGGGGSAGGDADVPPDAVSVWGGVYHRLGDVKAPPMTVHTGGRVPAAAAFLFQLHAALSTDAAAAPHANLFHRLQHDFDPTSPLPAPQQQFLQALACSTPAVCVAAAREAGLLPPSAARPPAAPAPFDTFWRVWVSRLTAVRGAATAAALVTSVARQEPAADWLSPLPPSGTALLQAACPADDIPNALAACVAGTLDAMWPTARATAAVPPPRAVVHVTRKAVPALEAAAAPATQLAALRLLHGVATAWQPLHRGDAAAAASALQPLWGPLLLLATQDVRTGHGQAVAGACCTLLLALPAPLPVLPVPSACRLAVLATTALAAHVVLLSRGDAGDSSELPPAPVLQWLAVVCRVAPCGRATVLRHLVSWLVDGCAPLSTASVLDDVEGDDGASGDADGDVDVDADGDVDDVVLAAVHPPTARRWLCVALGRCVRDGGSAAASQVVHHIIEAAASVPTDAFVMASPPPAFVVAAVHATFALVPELWRVLLCVCEVGGDAVRSPAVSAFATTALDGLGAQWKCVTSGKRVAQLLPTAPASTADVQRRLDATHAAAQLLVVLGMQPDDVVKLVRRMLLDMSCRQVAATLADLRCTTPADVRQRLLSLVVDHPATLGRWHRDVWGLGA